MYGLYLLVHAFESSATMRTRLIAARVIEGRFGGFFFDVKLKQRSSFGVTTGLDKQCIESIIS